MAIRPIIAKAWNLGKHGQSHQLLLKAHKLGIAATATATATAGAINHYEIPVSNIDPATVLAFCLLILPLATVANLAVFIKESDKVRSFASNLNKKIESFKLKKEEAGGKSLRKLLPPILLITGLVTILGYAALPLFSPSSTDAPENESAEPENACEAYGDFSDPPPELLYLNLNPSSVGPPPLIKAVEAIRAKNHYGEYGSSGTTLLGNESPQNKRLDRKAIDSLTGAGLRIVSFGAEHCLPCSDELDTVIAVAKGLPAHDEVRLMLVLLQAGWRNGLSYTRSRMLQSHWERQGNKLSLPPWAELQSDNHNTILPELEKLGFLGPDYHNSIPINLLVDNNGQVVATAKQLDEKTAVIFTCLVERISP